MITNLKIFSFFVLVQDLSFNQKIHIDAPEKVELPKQLKRISQKFIYGGSPFGKHYGHFLTDSLARLWYAIKEPSYPILVQEGHRKNFLQKTFVDQFFKSINLDKNRFISFSSPVLLEEVVIPYPSIINEIEGFEVHKLLPENVAKNLLPKKLEVTDQPLYLSRSKLTSDRRLTINEDKLEKKLNESGFAICFPEMLSLKQQIYLMNKHKVVIGSIGSAFHNILFDISDTKNIVYLTGEFLPSTYLIIDAIKSIKSTYIKVCDKDLNCSQKGTKQNEILNLDLAIDRLQDLGLI